MADYVPTPQDILAVRMNTGDLEAGLYIVSDDEISYHLKNCNGSISRASIDTARLTLLKISLNATDEIVSILSLKSSKQAEAYREALKLYISNPYLNPLIGNATLWAGNVSRSEMQTNNNTCDNNIPSLATQDLNPSCYSSDSNPFSI